MKIETYALLFLFVIGLTSIASAQPNPIDNMQPGEWYEVPNTHLRAVLPSPIPPGNPANIMTGWSSGAYDTKRNRLLVTGGGHNDYGGNEVYAFDINNLTWSRIWGPSLDIYPVNTMVCSNLSANYSEAYSDGNPVSRHTYDGLEYIPAIDSLWVQGGSLYCGGGGGGKSAWALDLNSLHWVRKSDPGILFSQILTAYDPVTQHLFVSGGASNNEPREYNPLNDSWTKRGYNSPGYNMAAVIDPARRKFISIGNDSMYGDYNYVYYYNITSNGTMARNIAVTTGDKEILNARYPGLAYDPISDRIVAWAGGPYVYTLDVDTWVWTKHLPVNSVVPTPAPGQGTFGRWQYIASKNAFIGVNSIDENVYIYKLGAGNGTGDIVPPVRSNGQPFGNISAGTTGTDINLTTDEAATCRYSTSPGTDYSSMAGTFTATGGTFHSTHVAGLSNGNTYDYYVRCADQIGNRNMNDFTIEFLVAVTDNQAPNVSITFPINGSTISGTITISATAADNFGVAGVQFKVDGNNAGTEDTASPYSVQWDSTGVINGTHTIKATARDAAGNTNISSVSIIVANAQQQQGWIDMPLKQWIALDLPNSNPSLNNGLKHWNGAFDPDNKRIYFMGGDHFGPPYGESYRQETYSFSIAERFANKNNSSAGWNLEYPYCSQSGQIQPKHPDFVGWTWDSKRKVFWMIPGTMVLFNLNCPGEFETNVSDTQYIKGRIMTFDPNTKLWSDVGAAGDTFTWQSVYDPVSDTIIRFNHNGGSGAQVQVYNISTNAWIIKNLGLNSAGKDMRLENGYLAADIDGRAIYTIDWDSARLHRYHIDTQQIEDLGIAPGGNLTCCQSPNLIWDSTNKVLLWYRHSAPFGFFAYHPNTGVWETLTTDTDLSGIPAAGVVMAYDPGQNVAILFGQNIQVAPSELLVSVPYMFIYRYANANASQHTFSIKISLDTIGSKITNGKLQIFSGASLAKEISFETNSTGDYAAALDNVPDNVNMKIIVNGFLVRAINNVNLNATSSIIFPPLLAGDINGDNVVNSLDFSNMNTKWYQSDAIADLNKDGIVNALDFSLMNKNWQRSGD
jgi:hypothetical protein